MNAFKTCKNGYDKSEVDLKLEECFLQINELKKNNDVLKKQLDNYKKSEKAIEEKNMAISLALTSAVSKAKQIEQSSQNVYKLKLQQLNILYAKWEKILNIVSDKYPEIENVENIKGLLKEFKQNIKTSIREDFKVSSMADKARNDNDTLRSLLSKIHTSGDKRIDAKRKQLPSDMLKCETELYRLEEKAPMIKPIYQSSVNCSKEDNLMDKFLTEDITENSAYSNIISSKTIPIKKSADSGFDLKEAVNPKEDLDEIMKAFDFFNFED